MGKASLVTSGNRSLAGTRKVLGGIVTLEITGATAEPAGTGTVTAKEVPSAGPVFPARSTTELATIVKEKLEPSQPLSVAIQS